MPLDEEVLEADKAYQNAGEKGVPRPYDPPRRRADKARGHGAWDGDRPPVCGVVGRDSGRVRLTVTERSDPATLEQVAREANWPVATVNTDEWGGYKGMTSMGRRHAAVSSAERERARGNDGDSIREVRDSAPEGLWTERWLIDRPDLGTGRACQRPSARGAASVRLRRPGRRLASPGREH